MMSTEKQSVTDTIKKLHRRQEIQLCRVCGARTMALRKIADDGLPPELAVSLVFPLLKALKPG